jgi:hypothetical protein
VFNLLCRTAACSLVLVWLGADRAEPWSPPPVDPPGAVLGATARLRFDSATPSSERSLEKQVRAGLSELLGRERGGAVLKLRVFAIGAPNLVAARRTIVGVFHAKRLPVPAIALAGVAGFPFSAQLVQIESTSAGATELNPAGLAFLAGVAARAGDQAVRGLARVATDGGVRADDVTRVSCFYESPTQVEPARQAIASTFPSARATFVRSTAAVDNPNIECEAVARLAERVSGQGVRYFNPPGSTPSPNFSRAAFVSTPSLLFTGTAAAAGEDTAGLREMFERAKRAVEPHGAGLPDVVMADNYWLTPAARDRLREVRPTYFGGTVPAASGVFFSSVEFPEGTAAMDLVLAVRAPGLVSAIPLPVGSSLVNGRPLYRSHLAAAVQTLSRSGQIVDTRRYTLDKYVTTWKGRPAFRLFLDAYPDGSGLASHAESVLDLATMGALHREEDDGRGRTLTADIDGAHVTGSAQASRDAPREALDFTLSQPSYFSNFLDAVVNAVDAREGQAFRLPAFDFAANGRRTVYQTYRVLGTDTVAVQGRPVPALVIELVSADDGRQRKIWTIREPPYFPMDWTMLPDGSEYRFAQTLIRLHD